MCEFAPTVEPSLVRQLPLQSPPCRADTTPLSFSSAICFPPGPTRPASGDGVRVLQSPDGGARSPQRPPPRNALLLSFTAS